MDNLSGPTNNSNFNFTTCSQSDESNSDLLNMVLLSILYVVVSALICIGNILVLDCYRKVDSARTVTNVFIVQLAVADLWVGITLPFISSFYIVRKLRLLNDIHYLCVFNYTLFILPACASVLGLLLMTLDRFLSILYPLRYRVRMNKKKAYALTVMLVWLPAVGGGFILPNIWREKFPVEGNGTAQECHDNGCDLVKNLKREYIQYIFVPCFTLFTLLIVVLYIPILHTVRKHLAAHKSSLKKGTNTPFVRTIIQRKEIKMMTTIIFILGAFFVCWIPLMSILAAEVYFAKDFSKWRGYLYIPTMLNSALNPIIYALRVPAFNQNLCSKLPCLKPLQIEKTSESGRFNSKGIHEMRQLSCQERPTVSSTTSTPSMGTPKNQIRIKFKSPPLTPACQFANH